MSSEMKEHGPSNMENMAKMARNSLILTIAIVCIGLITKMPGFLVAVAMTVAILLHCWRKFGLLASLFFAMLAATALLALLVYL